MRSINRIIICGTVGRDPETKTAQSGMLVSTISVATNKRDKEGRDTTQWHKCVGFLKTAEYIQMHVKKGSKVMLEGELQYGDYLNKDNVKMFTSKIVVSVISSVQDMPRDDENAHVISHKPSNNSHFYSTSSLDSDLEEELPF